MKKLLIVIAILTSIVFVTQQKTDTQVQLGADATRLIAGSTYTLAGSGISSTATSITLTSLTIPQNGYPIQDSDLSDTFYITLEPGSQTRQEIASCTTVTQNANGTATLSGCDRGLSPVSPYTASSSLRFAHAGGSRVIFSDPPQIFNDAAFKNNDETVTGIWTFDADNQPRYDAIPVLAGNSLYFASVGYVDALANQGAATSTETNSGIVELATAQETASSTQFDANNPHVINSENATSSPQAPCIAGESAGSGCVVVAENDGKLKQLWLRLSEAFTWSGAHVFNSTVDIEADADAKLTLNGVGYAFPTSAPSATSTIQVDSSGNITFLSSFASIDNTTTDVVSGNSTTSIKTIVIPANTLSDTNYLEINAIGFSNDATDGQYDVIIGNGLSSTSIAYTRNGGDAFSFIETKIFQNTGSNQSVYTNVNTTVPNGISPTTKAGDTLDKILMRTLSLNPASQLYLDFQCRPNDNGKECGYRGISAEVISQ